MSQASAVKNFIKHLSLISGVSRLVMRKTTLNPNDLGKGQHGRLELTLSVVLLVYHLTERWPTKDTGSRHR